MTARAAYPARCAAPPRTPLPSFGNQTGLTGRRKPLRVREYGCGVWGKAFCNNRLRSDFGPSGPNGPRYSLYMRAREKGGLGGGEIFHALPCISGRSGRSGRDPPISPAVTVAWVWSPVEFRTLSEPFRTHQTLSVSPEINILVSNHPKQQNIEK